MPDSLQKQILERLNNIDERLQRLEDIETRREAIEEYKKTTVNIYPPIWATKEGKALIGAVSVILGAIATYITIRAGL